MFAGGLFARSIKSSIFSNLEWREGLILRDDGKYRKSLTALEDGANEENMLSF